MYIECAETTQQRLCVITENYVADGGWRVRRVEANSIILAGFVQALPNIVGNMTPKPKRFFFCFIIAARLSFGVAKFFFMNNLDC